VPSSEAFKVVEILAKLLDIPQPFKRSREAV
jgi:hypothetical protein